MGSRNKVQTLELGICPVQSLIVSLLMEGRCKVGMGQGLFVSANPASDREWIFAEYLLNEGKNDWIKIT